MTFSFQYPVHGVSGAAMSSTPHIAIIGGGLIGLSCADSLMSRGVDVTIFEKDNRAGWGAGRYNSGMIHPSQSEPWLGEADNNQILQIIALANLSKILLQTRRRSLGVFDIDRPSGTLQIFTDESCRMLARKRYNDLGIRSDIYEGPWGFGRPTLKFPDDGSASAFLYMEALSLNLAVRGCRIITGQAAHPMIIDGQCVGVSILNDVIKADVIIVASGSGSLEIMRSSGVDLPIEPVIGHALVFKRPHTDLPDIPVMDSESRSAMTVFRDQVRLSGTVGEASPEGLRFIWEEIAPDLMARLGQPRVKWSAARPASKLGRPFISPTKINQLWINSGHGHMGWSLCSASGELMADMILEGRTAPEFILP